MSRYLNILIEIPIPYMPSDKHLEFDGLINGWIYIYIARQRNRWMDKYVRNCMTLLPFFSEPVKKYGLSADEHFQFLKQFSDKTTPIDYDFLIK